MRSRDVVATVTVAAVSLALTGVAVAFGWPLVTGLSTFVAILSGTYWIVAVIAERREKRRGQAHTRMITNSEGLTNHVAQEHISPLGRRFQRAWQAFWEHP